MVHKNKVSAEQERIKALEEELRLLELKQKEQELQAKVSTKAFWTRHKNLRDAVESAKSAGSGYAKFVKTEALPAVRGVVRELTKPETATAKRKRLARERASEREYRRVMSLR